MGIPMEETWKPVIGYEGLYEISSLGQVRSLFRYKKTLKWNISRNGYATVELFKDKSGKRLLVHRLVAMAFVQNKYDKEQVNHIDENKLNNATSNLCWVSAKENMEWGTRLFRQKLKTDYGSDKRKSIARENGKKARKPIVQCSKDGAVLAIFESAKAASMITGASHSHICECASGRRYKTVNGYVWKYVDF